MAAGGLTLRTGEKTEEMKVGNLARNINTKENLGWWRERRDCIKRVGGILKKEKEMERERNKVSKEGRNE